MLWDYNGQRKKGLFKAHVHFIATSFEKGMAFGFLEITFDHFLWHIC